MQTLWRVIAYALLVLLIVALWIPAMMAQPLY